MKYRIHFTDSWGPGIVEVDGENYDEVYKNIKDDPECDGIWVEQYNEEEGYWEA